MTTRLPWYEPLLHFFMPNRCMCCDRYFDQATTQALCARCAPSLYPILGAVCECCGHPIESLRRLEPDWPTGRCAACERASPAYLQAASLWRYDGVISQVGKPAFGRHDATFACITFDSMFLDHSQPLSQALVPLLFVT